MPVANDAMHHASIRSSKFIRLAGLTLLGLVVLHASRAAEPAPPPRLEFVSTVGEIGIRQREPADTMGSAELRLPQNWHGIRPWFGASALDNGTWFAGGGFIYDVRLHSNWTAALGTGPFYYKNRHHNLGLDLEFYSFLEVTHPVWHDIRAGLRVGHLSNGGLGRRNPGTEDVLFVTVVPLGS